VGLEGFLMGKYAMQTALEKERVLKTNLDTNLMYLILDKKTGKPMTQ
jgi:hypothetical protein